MTLDLISNVDIQGVVNKIDYQPNIKANQIAAIWFYESGNMEIVIRGTMYCLSQGEIFSREKFSQVIELTLKGKRSPFYSFVIHCKERKVTEIEEKLNRHKGVSFSTCSGCSASIINQCSELQIPFLKSIAPASLGFFLFEEYKKNNRLISYVENYSKVRERRLGDNVLLGKKVVYMNQIPACLCFLAPLVIIIATLVLGGAILLGEKMRLEQA